MLDIRKLNNDEIITAIYFDGELEKYYVKRFQLNGDHVINREYSFISEYKGSKLIGYSFDYLPRVEVEIKPKAGNEVEFEVVPLADFIAVKGYKAKGKRLSNKEVRKIKMIDPLPYTPPEDEQLEEEDFIEDKPKKENKIPTSAKSESSKKDPPDPDESPPQMELDF